MIKMTMAAGVLALLASCVAGDEPPPPWPDPGQPEELFGRDALPTIDLRLAPDALASLEAQPREYVEAYLVHGGVEYGPVGVRLKGSNSFLPIEQKPSLKLNINYYVPGATMWGFKDLTLNNMSSDTSMMHERLAYQVAREAGVPASRANHASLTINGEPYGLYTVLEPVKPRMLGEWFADNTGALFEGNDADFVRHLLGNFEHKSGPDDRRALEGLAAALTRADADAALAEAAAFVDLDQFRLYWALMSVIGHFDGFPYSDPGDDFYLYADPGSGRLSFIPWGMDETFLSAELDPTITRSVLARTCRRAASCFQAYVDQVWDVLALTEAMDLAAERARVVEQIAPLIEADERRPYDDAAVAEGQLQMYYFIRHRRETLGAMMPPAS
jgi:hypothetical protein